MTFAPPAQRGLLISCKNSHIISLDKDKTQQRLPRGNRKHAKQVILPT